MRWLLLFATLLSWVLCLTRHGPGAMAFWLLLGLAGVLATALAFAQARIEANAQPEPSMELIRQQQRQKPSAE